MLAIVTIQLIYLKLGKKGPNTRMCFYTNSCHREQTRTPIVFSSHSLSTKISRSPLRLVAATFSLDDPVVVSSLQQECQLIDS